MMGDNDMTQRTVKTICKAFGFKAKYSPEYQEWCIVRTDRPFTDVRTFYTNDADDAIYTMLYEYRIEREAKTMPSVETMAFRINLGIRPL